MVLLFPQGRVPVHLPYQSSEFHPPSNTGENSIRKSGQAELIKETDKMFRNTGGTGRELGKPLLRYLLSERGELRLGTEVRMGSKQDAHL